MGGEVIGVLYGWDGSTARVSACPFPSLSCRHGDSPLGWGHRRYCSHAGTPPADDKPAAKDHVSPPGTRETFEKRPTSSPPPPHCWYDIDVSNPWEWCGCDAGVPYLESGCECAWMGSTDIASRGYDAAALCCSNSLNPVGRDSAFVRAGDGGACWSMVSSNFISGSFGWAEGRSRQSSDSASSGEQLRVGTALKISSQLSSRGGAVGVQSLKEPARAHDPGEKSEDTRSCRLCLFFFGLRECSGYGRSDMLWVRRLFITRREIVEWQESQACSWKRIGETSSAEVLRMDGRRDVAWSRTVRAALSGRGAFAFGWPRTRRMRRMVRRMVRTLFQQIPP